MSQPECEYFEVVKVVKVLENRQYIADTWSNVWENKYTMNLSMTLQ